MLIPQLGVKAKPQLKWKGTQKQDSWESLPWVPRGQEKGRGLFCSKGTFHATAKRCWDPTCSLGTQTAASHVNVFRCLKELTTQPLSPMPCALWNPMSSQKQDLSKWFWLSYLSETHQSLNLKPLQVCRTKTWEQVGRFAGLCHVPTMEFLGCSSVCSYAKSPSVANVSRESTTSCGTISPHSFLASQRGWSNGASQEDARGSTPMVESPCAVGVNESSLVVILLIPVEQLQMSRNKKLFC